MVVVVFAVFGFVKMFFFIFPLLASLCHWFFPGFSLLHIKSARSNCDLICDSFLTLPKLNIDAVKSERRAFDFPPFLAGFRSTGFIIILSTLFFRMLNAISS